VESRLYRRHPTGEASVEGVPEGGEEQAALDIEALGVGESTPVPKTFRMQLGCI